MENPTATTAPKHPATPVRMNSVVVFGDSLSDIGKKWTSKSGRAARVGKAMYVSPTGRFSDCRNWADFMFEAASGESLVVGSAEGSIAKSEKHFTYTPDSVVLATDQRKRFWYANYAEGGACGDEPASLGSVLGTFKQQVDAFEIDCMKSPLPLGNTLFIIWFGANDLYTANCSAASMAKVAQQIASTQRTRLLRIFRDQNYKLLGPDVAKCSYKFIFVDLCRPLTSVRYSKLLSDAEAKVRTLVGWVHKTKPSMGGVAQANYTLQQASEWGHKPSTFFGANDVELLRRQVELTKNLEQGVLLFNSTLATHAYKNGDRVAQVGSCISEDTIRKLVTGNYRLMAGAMPAKVTTHISAQSYNQSSLAQHVITIDEVHPTDQMYKLIWMEIYEQIRRSNCTFGNLVPSDVDVDISYIPQTPLTALSQDRQGYGAVMNQLLAKRRRID
jgi:lysophospholipase L1-like esterase